MTVRKYGEEPFRVAVLHGGPGAPGSMAPVGRDMGETVGVLEPFQSEDSIDGQVEELRGQVREHGETPITLIGSSWGAVLALFFAARHPKLTRKIILVGSAVFDAESSAQIGPARLARLTEDNRKRHDEILQQLDDAPDDQRDALLAEWGTLLSDVDMYDPITRELEVEEVQFDVHTKVWSDFVAMRDGKDRLKTEFSKITCPTVIIHGEYDPHPIDGIRPFLETCIDDVSCHVLPKCGHYPWIEKHAREAFFEMLRGEV